MPEAGFTNIYCVRHTATDWQHGGLCYSDVELGLTVPPLSEEGIHDAYGTGATMRRNGIPIDAVFVSPYLRTLETARGILAGGGYTDILTVIDHNLGEVWAHGILQSGLDIFKLRWPHETFHPENGEICGDIYEVADQFGYAIESPSEMAWRVNYAFSVIHAYFTGLSVLVVSHSDPLSFGIHQREIGHGPMPTTAPLETSRRRYNKGQGMFISLGPDGYPVDMQTLDFGPDGADFTVGTLPYLE